MAKRLAFLLFVLFIPALAQADTIDTVSIAPTTFNLGPVLNPNDIGNPANFETVSVSFTWDVTTNVLTNIVLTATGPGGSLPNTPDTIFNPNGIDLLNFVGPTSIFQVSNEGSGSGTVIRNDRLGTYGIATFFAIDGWHEEEEAFVTVTPTPEPASILLLVVGLGAVALVCSARSKTLATNFA